MAEIKPVDIIEIFYNPTTLKACSAPPPQNKALDKCMLDGSIGNSGSNDSKPIILHPLQIFRHGDSFEINIRKNGIVESLSIPDDIKTQYFASIQNSISMQLLFQKQLDAFTGSEIDKKELTRIFNTLMNDILWRPESEAGLYSREQYRRLTEEVLALAFQSNADEKIKFLIDFINQLFSTVLVQSSQLDFKDIVRKMHGKLSVTANQKSYLYQAWYSMKLIESFQKSFAQIKDLQTADGILLQAKSVAAFTNIILLVHDKKWQPGPIDWDLQNPATLNRNNDFFKRTAAARELVFGLLHDVSHTYSRLFPNRDPNELISMYKTVCVLWLSRNAFRNEDKIFEQKLRTVVHYLSEAENIRLASLWHDVESNKLSPKEAFAQSLKNIYGGTRIKKDIIDIFLRHSQYEMEGCLLTESPDGDAIKSDLESYYQKLNVLEQPVFAKALDDVINLIANARFRNKPTMVGWCNGHFNWGFNFHYYAKSVDGRRDMGFVVDWANKIFKTQLKQKPSTPEPFRPAVLGTLGGLSLVGMAGTSALLVKYEPNDWRYLTGWSVTGGLMGSFFGELICYSKNFNPSWDKNHWFCPTMGGLIGSGVTAGILFGIFGFKNVPIQDDHSAITPVEDNSKSNFVQEYGPLRFQFNGNF